MPHHAFKGLGKAVGVRETQLIGNLADGPAALLQLVERVGHFALKQEPVRRAALVLPEEPAETGVGGAELAGDVRHVVNG